VAQEGAGRAAQQGGARCRKRALRHRFSGRGRHHTSRVSGYGSSRQQHCDARHCAHTEANPGRLRARQRPLQRDINSYVISQSNCRHPSFAEKFGAFCCCCDHPHLLGGQPADHPSRLIARRLVADVPLSCSTRACRGCSPSISPSICFDLRSQHRGQDAGVSVPVKG